MERLTTHTKTIITKEVSEVFGFDEGTHEAIEISKCGNETCAETCERVDGCEKCPIKEAIDKLADYEDAEENGLLLRLPCRIGDVVHRVLCSNDDFKYHVFDVEVREIVMYEWGTFFKCVNAPGFSIRDFGKSVFATKEEAEAALQALQKKQEGGTCEQ